MSMKRFVEASSHAQAAEKVIASLLRQGITHQILLVQLAPTMSYQQRLARKVDQLCGFYVTYERLKNV